MKHHSYAYIILFNPNVEIEEKKITDLLYILSKKDLISQIQIFSILIDFVKSPQAVQIFNEDQNFHLYLKIRKNRYEMESFHEIYFNCDL